MLSFASSLSPDSEAFVIFVTEKYVYKDKRDVLSSDTVQKINSFLSVLKVKKKRGRYKFYWYFRSTEVFHNQGKK